MPRHVSKRTRMSLSGTWKYISACSKKFSEDLVPIGFLTSEYGNSRSPVPCLLRSLTASCPALPPALFANTCHLLHQTAKSTFAFASILPRMLRTRQKLSRCASHFLGAASTIPTRLLCSPAFFLSVLKPKEPQSTLRVPSFRFRYGKLHIGRCCVTSWPRRGQLASLDSPSRTMSTKRLQN